MAQKRAKKFSAKLSSEIFLKIAQNLSVFEHYTKQSSGKAPKFGIYFQPGDSSGLTRIKRETKDFNLKASYEYGVKGGLNIKMETPPPQPEN